MSTLKKNIMKDICPPLNKKHIMKNTMKPRLNFSDFYPSSTIPSDPIEWSWEDPRGSHLDGRWAESPGLFTVAKKNMKRGWWNHQKPMVKQRLNRSTQQKKWWLNHPTWWNHVLVCCFVDLQKAFDVPWLAASKIPGMKVFISMMVWWLSWSIYMKASFLPLAYWLSCKSLPLNKF